MSIYDAINERLTIGPFDYEPLEYADKCLNLPSQVLLKVFILFIK